MYDFGPEHDGATTPEWATRAAAETLAWVRSFVVGLELCPFARVPLERGRVSIRVSDVDNGYDLAEELQDELLRLQREPAERVETTLLVHPRCHAEFEAQNDFLDVVDLVLDRLDLVGEIQVVAFHPHYRFEDTPVDAPENATNRSPHPMLHLLREASVSAAVATLDDPDAVWRANVAKLRERARARGGPLTGG